MLNKVRLNTCVVDGKREASTVLAIKAAFVESEAGNLEELLAHLSSCVDWALFTSPQGQHHNRT
jgi:hypothetical protein